MSAEDKDFLDGMGDATEDIEAEEVEVEEVEEPEKVEETPAEPEAVPTPAEPVEDDRVPLKALKAEREKRQTYEKELAALRQQLEEKQPEQDFYANPEEYVSNQVKSIQQQMTNRLYSVLEAEAKEAFEDYDEVMDALEAKVKENPALQQQIFSAPNPAKAAYKLGKQLQEMEAMKDPEAYKAKLKADLKAELLAEMQAESEARAKKSAEIPPDLASERTTKEGQVDRAKDTFDELFPTF